MNDRVVQLVPEDDGFVLIVGIDYVECLTRGELAEFVRLAEAHLTPDATGLEVTRYEVVEDTLPHIASPDDLYDEASAYRDALAANFFIQAEARAVYGDPLSDGECLDRVIAARWPNLPERDAYLAAAAHYEVELPLTPTQQSEAEMAGERA